MPWSSVTTTLTRFAVLGLVALGAACEGRDERPPVWEYISPALLQPNCATASCHGPAAAAAGLDFSDPDRGYTSLTGLWVWIVDPNGTPESGCRRENGTTVCQRALRPLVTPFNPSQSRLLHLLRGHASPRMPPDRPLPAVDVELIERWIMNGAEKTSGCAVVTKPSSATEAAH